MSTTSPQPTDFVNRRSTSQIDPNPGVERRQFVDSHDSLSPDAQDLASAIEGYKMNYRRRFITYEEMLQVILELGYSK